MNRGQRRSLGTTIRRVGLRSRPTAGNRRIVGTNDAIEVPIVVRPAIRPIAARRYATPVESCSVSLCSSVSLLIAVSSVSSVI